LSEALPEQPVFTTCHDDGHLPDTLDEWLSSIFAKLQSLECLTFLLAAIFEDLYLI
jgi:hypothetical protein